MKRLFILILTAVTVSINTNASYSSQNWAKTYGEDYNDSARSIQQTVDGGSIVAGYTSSFGAGNYDIWVLNLNPDGTVNWQKTYGESDDDYAISMQQTEEGGYIVAGYTSSFGVSDHDIWVLNINPDGTVNWQKTYGGSGWDEARSIQQTEEGGYIVAGYTSSFGAGNYDIWVLNINPDGTVNWQKTYGGSNDDYALSIQQTEEGGYVMAGFTSSFGAGDWDIWVLKLDSNGEVTWQKIYGGGNNDQGRYIQQTANGGYILAGFTFSFGAGGWDIWVLKLDSSGGVSWQKTYGGGSDDWAHSIQQTSDGGYIVAGETHSFGAGGVDIWILKFDSGGNVSWKNTYGESNNDWSIPSIQQTMDGGYVMASSTLSFGAGYDDFLVLKLDSNGGIPDCDIIGESDVIAYETYISGADTYITAQTTTATINDTSITPQDSSSLLSMVCYYDDEDIDSDIILDIDDNCPKTPNGQFLGTCVKTLAGMVASYRAGDPPQVITCLSNDDCAATGGTCDRDQGNCNANSCGDVCECYADFNDDEKVTAPDYALLKQEFGRFDCDLNPCLADGNEDGKVTAPDYALLRGQFGRYNCPACQ